MKFNKLLTILLFSFLTACQQFDGEKKIINYSNYQKYSNTGFALIYDKQLKKESGYKSRLLWVGQKHFNIIRTDYFNRRGKLIKRQTTDKWVNVEGNAWRANYSLMEHLKNKHKTITEVLERSLKESDSPAKNFRKKTITSGKLAR